MKQETLKEAAERILANNIEGLRNALKDDDLFFFYKGVIQCYGEAMANWQQEQDNKELAMWKLAVEKQEARCTSLRGVISDLQDKNKYSEEDMRLAFQAGHKKGFSGYPNTENWKELPFNEWFKQYKKNNND
jgi:hypothetical protein